MLLSRWTMLQFATLGLLIGFVVYVEFLRTNRTVEVTGAMTPVNNPIETLLFVSAVLSCFYLFFLLEAKKGTDVFERSFWQRMPIATVIIGSSSFVIFISAVFLGDLFSIMQDNRFFLYVIILYFMFLLFLFVFSMVLKFGPGKKGGNDRFEKASHKSLLFSVLIFVCIFFLI